VPFYVVSFDCEEYEIREGPDVASVLYDDDLGCPAISAKLTDSVQINAVWLKNGILRCSIKEG
jgi:hypothetical protein